MYILFVQDDCPKCLEVELALNALPICTSVIIVKLSDKSENVDDWANADFYDVFEFPALRKTGSSNVLGLDGNPSAIIEFLQGR